MTRAKQILAGLIAAADSIAILDLKGVVDLLPDGWAIWVAGVPTMAAAVVHLAQAFLKGLDQIEPPKP